MDDQKLIYGHFMCDAADIGELGVSADNSGEKQQLLASFLVTRARNVAGVLFIES